MDGDAGESVTVVIATHNRPSELRRTLSHLIDLPEAPQIIVIENRSTSERPEHQPGHDPRIQLVELPTNLGAAARTVGARLATTPYVAFCDDDAWWEPRSLSAAVDRLDADPRIGLVAARILVGPERTVDPTSAIMETGPLDEWLRPSPDGTRGVTGFLACAAVVRRAAFLAVGGFDPHLHIGGEEELVALDLADAGWKLVYLPHAVVRHFPSDQRDVPARQRMLTRNEVLVAGLRYSGRAGAGRLGRWARIPPSTARRSALATLKSGPWMISRRRPVRPEIEAAFLRPPVSHSTHRGRRVSNWLPGSEPGAGGGRTSVMPASGRSYSWGGGPCRRPSPGEGWL